MMADFYSGYNDAAARTERSTLAQLQQLQGVQSIIGHQQEQEEKRRAFEQEQMVRGIIQKGGDPATTMAELMKVGPVGVKVAGDLAQLQKHAGEAAQASREAAFYSPQNQQRYMNGGSPAVTPLTPNDDEGNAMPSSPAVPPSFDVNSFRRDAATLSPKGMETYSAHQAAERQRIATLEATKQAREEANARLREQDQGRRDDNAERRAQAERQFNETLATRREIAASRPGKSLHFERTVDDSGKVTVHAFDDSGALVKSTDTGGKAPSVLSNENVRERQLATGLEAVKKPHLDVLNAYQRYGEIRNTGDNAQANQFLAQQLMKMATTGQRAIPKAELERILGSGDLGNDFIGRAANMVSQMAAGVRTPTIDKRLNDLADAMGKASADRIGQEIQNTIARTPPGVDPTRVVGAKPTIYGRFIITPSGKVHTFASPQEAQAKLQEAAKVVEQ